MVSGWTRSFCQVEVVATSPSRSSSFEYRSNRTNDIWSSGSLPMSDRTKTRGRPANSSARPGSGGWAPAGGGPRGTARQGAKTPRPPRGRGGGGGGGAGGPGRRAGPGPPGGLGGERGRKPVALSATRCRGQEVVGPWPEGRDHRGT